MIPRIEDWKERRGKAKGRAETDRVLVAAHKLIRQNQRPADRAAAAVVLGGGRRR